MHFTVSYFGKIASLEMNTGFCTMVFYTILQEESNHAHQHRRKALPGCSLPGGRIRLRYLAPTPAVPKSTFYTWIKPYTVTMTDSGHAVSQQAFIKMKQKLQKLEKKIEILQKVNCTGFSVASRKAARACQIAWSV